jgi:hypothetical protein
MSNKTTATKPTTTTTTSTTTKSTDESEADVRKTDFSGLKKALQDKGVSFNEFVAGPEERRKSLLGDDYQETRTKYHWVYDQPITEEEPDKDKDKEKE